MKKIYATLLFAAVFSEMSFAQECATFEDLGLAAESYWNGADGAGSFTSGDYTFSNTFTDYGYGYTSWDGFAYSSMTSKAYNTLDDQYNCCVGHGANMSQTFAVVYYNSYGGTFPTITNKDGKPFEIHNIYVTNSAYAYTSMKDGDAYAKKFDENDWFLLTINGYLEGEKVGSVEFYLASNGQIVDDWNCVNLEELGTVNRVEFSLSSSDTGEWGMNTPAYFCLDNFNEATNPDAIKEVNRQSSTSAIYDLQGRRTSSSNGFLIIDGKVIKK